MCTSSSALAKQDEGRAINPYCLSILGTARTAETAAIPATMPESKNTASNPRISENTADQRISDRRLVRISPSPFENGVRAFFAHLLSLKVILHRLAHLGNPLIHRKKRPTYEPKP